MWRTRRASGLGCQLIAVKTPHLRPEMHAVTKMVKMCQNRQFRRADFALTILTKIPQNRQIEEHSLRLTKFRQICHFRDCVPFWT